MAASISLLLLNKLFLPCDDDDGDDDADDGLGGLRKDDALCDLTLPDSAAGWWWATPGGVDDIVVWSEVDEAWCGRGDPDDEKEWRDEEDEWLGRGGEEGGVSIARKRMDESMGRAPLVPLLLSFSSSSFLFNWSSSIRFCRVPIFNVNIIKYLINISRIITWLWVIYLFVSLFQ